MRRASATPWLAAGLLLTGCAIGPGLFGADEGKPVFRDPALSVPHAASLLQVGRQRREDVAARLGPAETVRFDTGYEVWVYRSHGRDAAAQPELVLLFDPAGVLSKARLRQGSPAGR